MPVTPEMGKRMLLGALQDSTNAEYIITKPIRLRLMQINGDAEFPGTEVVGSSYVPSDASFSLSGSTSAIEVVNSLAIQFNSLDPDVQISVAGVELWDSSTVPVRLAYTQFTSPVIVAPGAPLTISPTQLKVTLS